MKIEIVSTDSLRLHPFLEQLPDPSSELMTTMAIDIENNDFREPLIIDEKNRVMDGRIRLKVALQMDLNSVPVVRRKSSEAATIIVQSLLQRQHFSKSALAYICFPFFESMLSEQRGRISTQNVLIQKTAEDLARSVGVSRSLFLQAREVHKLFKKHPQVKEVIEPKILSGDLCLGYAINGIAGLVATKGKDRGNSEQLELFRRGFNSLRVRFGRWDQLPAKQRLVIAHEFSELVSEIPEEVCHHVAAALRNRKAVAK